MGGSVVPGRGSSGDRGVLRWEVAVVFQTKLMVTAHRCSASCMPDTVLKALHPLSQSSIFPQPRFIGEEIKAQTAQTACPRLLSQKAVEPGSLAPESVCSAMLLCCLVFNPLEMQMVLPITLQCATLHSGGSLCLILILALVVLVLSSWFISI